MESNPTETLFDAMRFSPLSDVAKDVLLRLQSAPIPRSHVNPGIVHRLQCEGLVELKECQLRYSERPLFRLHLVLTEKGWRWKP
jgi:hypothetical protein